jgi:hypothetical protein
MYDSCLPTLPSRRSGSAPRGGRCAAEPGQPPRCPPNTSLPVIPRPCVRPCDVEAVCVAKANLGNAGRCPRGALDLRRDLPAGLAGPAARPARTTKAVSQPEQVVLTLSSATCKLRPRVKHTSEGSDPPCPLYQASRLYRPLGYLGRECCSADRRRGGGCWRHRPLSLHCDVMEMS